MGLRGNALIRRPRVVFIINEVAHFTEYKKMLSLQDVNSGLEPILLFDRDGFDIQQLFSKEIKDCEQNKIKYFIFPDATRKYAASSDGASSFRARLFNRLKKVSLVRLFFEARHEVEFYRRKIAGLQIFFQEQKIDTIVIGEENILMDTFVYKRAAQDRKVFVSPYTIPNPKEMVTGAFCHFPAFSIPGLLLSLFAGRFSLTVDQKTFLILKFSKILSFFWVGYFPKNPWVLNYDNADLVLLESQQMANIYKRLKVPESHIKVIGSLNDDRLLAIKNDQAHLKWDFLKKYNLPMERPIILVSFPPNQFPRPNTEQKNYDELIASFQDALLPYISNYSIVITKHPRIKHSLAPLIQAGFTVVDEATINLLPFAYVYLASASATIRWAISSGIPVVNYDVYNYHYGDYDDAKSITTVFRIADLKLQFKKLLEDESYYNSVLAQQRKDSALWGIQDGQVSKRFVDILLKSSQIGDHHAHS